MVEPEDTRQRLLAVAGEKFAEKGFEATNVREITEPIGASPAAVNYHFRSKRHLYIEAVQQAAANCVRLAPLPVFPPDLPAEERLRRFIHMLLTRLLHPDIPPWNRVLMMREVTQPRFGAGDELVRRFIRPTFEALIGILRDLVPAETSPADLRLLGSSIVGQCLHYHHVRHILGHLVGPEEAAGYSIDRLAEHIGRFSLAGLRGLAPPDAKGGSS